MLMDTEWAKTQGVFNKLVSKIIKHINFGNLAKIKHTFD